MLRAWPRRGATTNTSYVDAPTDAFYADLTGDWDLDGDGYPGEFRHDGGSGGVDFVPELFVGRIPVYGGEVATLDGILRKTIAYESSAGDLAWRRSVLLPMSFSDQHRRRLARRADEGGVPPRAGLLPVDPLPAGHGGGKTRSSRRTRNCAGAPSPSAGGRLPTAWSPGGGTARRRARSIGYTGAWDGDLLGRADPALDDAAPAFVYQTACLNGYPETRVNLGYGLLKRGAIATVAASRVSWYAMGQRTSGVGDQRRARLPLRLAPHRRGERRPALALAKGDPAVEHGSDAAWMNLMDFNLYGDPSVGLFRGPCSSVRPVRSRSRPRRASRSPSRRRSPSPSGDAPSWCRRRVDAAWSAARRSRRRLPRRSP